MAVLHEHACQEAAPHSPSMADQIAEMIRLRTENYNALSLLLDLERIFRSQRFQFSVTVIGNIYQVVARRAVGTTIVVCCITAEAGTA